MSFNVDSKLSLRDTAMFSRLGIPAEFISQAKIERVTDREAREKYGIVGYGDMAGICFPYMDPMNGHRWTARVRRDNPEMEGGKPRNKYISPYGDRRHLYFPPGSAELMHDPAVPIVLVEAEKSALALVTWAARMGRKLLPIGMGGCWGWRGRIGKVENSNGEQVDEVGPISDLGFASSGRTTYVLLDGNVATNPKVQQARAGLDRQLRKQGADVLLPALPVVEGVNGPDDYIALCGDEAMAQVLAGAEAGAAILDEIAHFIGRFMRMSESQLFAAALWCAHTYAIDAAIWTPYLAVTSAVKRCAKSRLLDVLSFLVRNPWSTSSASAASLFREIDQARPTLLLDELDALFKGDKETAQMVRAVLNAGAHHKGKVSRCVGKGADIVNKNFSAFCAKALGGIDELPDTVADRSLPIRLKRKLPGDKVERLRERVVEPQAAPLRKRLASWVSSQLPALKEAYPELPEELNDRQQDGAECLLAIADAAGGEWPTRARRALVELYTGEAAEDQSHAIVLLADIRTIFSETRSDKIPSTELLAKLIEIESSPWAEWNRGKPLTPTSLARLLKLFAISPGAVRDSGVVFKGYERNSFTDAWDRYLPENGADACIPASEQLQRLKASVYAEETRFSTRLQGSSVTAAKSEESPVFMRVVTDVTAPKAKNGEQEQEECMEGVI